VQIDTSTGHCTSQCIDVGELAGWLIAIIVIAVLLVIAIPIIVCVCCCAACAGCWRAQSQATPSVIVPLTKGPTPYGPVGVGAPAYGQAPGYPQQQYYAPPQQYQGQGYPQQQYPPGY
jgi:hypothetical protein